MHVIAVVPSAGSGSRFGAAVPKQFLDLAGRPVISWTLERFVSAGVGSIVVPVAPSDRRVMEDIASAARVPVTLVDGGATRQESVLAGVRHAFSAGPDAFVAVHDAVRPCFSRDLWERLLAAAGEVGAAVPVVTPTDTVHQLSEGFVTATPPRERLGLAQTPQLFRVAMLAEVMEAASATGVTGTDEAGLVASAGHRVAAVQGDEANMKITTPGDLDRIARDLDRWRTW